MPRFTIIPPIKNLEPAEFIAEDSGQVLAMVHRLGWKSADVRRDGDYLFSLALNREGVWSISQRRPADGA